MLWSDYYAGFYDWADSTQVSRISGLTGFRSSASSAEVAEIAQALFNDTAARRLVKAAITDGTRFSPDEIMELILNMDKQTLSMMADTAFGSFTREQLEEINGSIDDNVFERISKKSGIDIFADDVDARVKAGLDAPDEEPNPANTERTTRMGILSKLIVAKGMMDEMNKKDAPHKGRCDGDCAHCPPHYGYRYGRWYYGHHHSYGCEFGGNDGSGKV